MSGPLAVSGGRGGVTAQLDDLDRLAASLAARAAVSAAAARAAAGLAAAPVLLASTALDPPGGGRARADLAAGTLQLLHLAAQLSGLGDAAAGAVRGYRAADAAGAAAWAVARRALLHALGPPLLVVAAGAAGAGAAAVAGGSLAAGGSAAAASLTAGATPARAAAAGRRAAERAAGPLALAHLGAVGAAVPRGARDELVEQSLAATGVPVPVLAAGLLAAAPFGAWAATTATAQRAGPPLAGAPATGTGDLLRRVHELSPRQGAAPGSIRVDRLSGGGRPPTAVVHLPATQQWFPVGGANPVDGETNVRAVAGQRTAAGDGVVRALRAAGVGRSEPVLLVGYSQGGITAAQLAADPAFRAEFTPRAVLTAGSPIAGTPVPDGVAVLALEHDGDPIPGLDGAANPDRRGWTTVAAASAGPAHSAPAYAATGDLVDASDHPSLVAWRADLAPFLAVPPAAPGAPGVPGVPGVPSDDPLVVTSTTWVLRRDP